MFKKCISLLLVCLVVTSVFMIVPVETKAASYKDEFIDAILKSEGDLWNEEGSTSYGYFKLIDLNFDGRIEFIKQWSDDSGYSLSSTSPAAVYYLKNNKLVQAESWCGLNNELTGYYDEVTNEYILLQPSKTFNGYDNNYTLYNNTLEFDGIDVSEYCYTSMIKKDDDANNIYYKGGYGDNTAKKITKSEYDSINFEIINNCVNINLQYDKINGLDWINYSSSQKRQALEKAYDSFTYDKCSGDMVIYSDYTNLTVELGDTINIGAGIFKNDSQVTDVSKVTCSVYDHSILSVKSTTVKDNCRFYEFDTHSLGTTYVTFSDSNTGYTKRVPVSVCDTKDSAYTVSNIPTVKIGDYTANFYNSNGLYIDNYQYSTASDGKTTVKFDVYNHNYIYGAVEVYNSNGVLTDAIVIDKMTNLKGSIKETVWDGPYYLVEDIIEGDIFTYKETISSKHTPVEVVIPKDGYIKITTDTINSNLVALLNGIDIAMGLKGVVGEIKGFDTNSKFFAEKITKEIVNNAIYAKLAKDENKFAKDLMKGFVKKTTIFSTKSMGSFVDSFVNNLSELKLEKLIFDTAVDFGWSTSEDLFQYFAGPIGMAMKGLFAAGDAANVIIQCKHLDDRMYCGNICIQNQSGGTRTSSQVTVKSDTNFDSNTAFRVYEVAIDSSEFEIVKELNPQLYEEITSMPSVIYNIAMIKDGKETQLNGKVEVVIPIPDEMKHLERSNGIVVYRIEEDGTKTEMIVEVRDGNLVFRTDHFSLYVISADVFGDTDSDGEVSIMDATAIQLHIAKISSLSTHQINNADTDGDGEVSIMDATEIQLFVAELIPALGERESITLSSTQLTMNVGDKKTLTATVKPSSLSDATITWSSSNSSIVSVVNGVVEAKGLGTATITAKTKSGVTAKCTITVKDKTIEVSSIKLNSNGISLNEGNTYQLVATVLPENATNKTLTWSTNNPSVATVSSSGKITAVSIGKATITAKSSNGVTITCAVSVVPIQVSSITLSDTNEVLYLGFTHFLTATVKPDNANDKSLTWSSSDTSVVTVSSSGSVTAKGLGTATVTARATNGVSASCVFTVCDILPDSMTLSKNTNELDVGQSFQLTGTITPSYATNKTITWSSSDTSVATVTQSGNIKAVGNGKATITAKTVNGIKAVCEITSYTPVSGTYELLLNLRKNPAGCYRLTADDTLNTLDLNIDTFTGCINGDGHTITITYDSTSKNVTNNCYKALLPKTDGATIKNLNISGTIDHEMYSEGSYSNYCAGFVAYAENTTFVNCTNEAMVKSTIWSNYSGYGYVGGITAWSNNCSFTDCTNKGGLQVTTMPVKVASSIAGGISGQSSGCKFDSCSNRGNVYTHSSNSSDTYYSLAYSGGIIGSSNSAELKRCVTSGNMIAYAWPDYKTYYTSVAASGGIIAYGNGKIENCSSSCKLSPSATNGGVIYKGDSIAYKN